LPSTRPSSGKGKGQSKKAVVNNNFRGYLSEETTAELWSTGNYDQSGAVDQQPSAKFRDVFGIDDNENAVTAGAEGQAFVLEYPDIGLPDDR
jgi:hypothetical protein